MKGLRTKEWPINEATNTTAAKRPSACRGRAAKLGIGLLSPVGFDCGHRCVEPVYQIRRSTGDAFASAPALTENGERGLNQLNGTKVCALPNSKRNPWRSGGALPDGISRQKSRAGLGTITTILTQSAACRGSTGMANAPRRARATHAPTRPARDLSIFSLLPAAVSRARWKRS